MFKIYTEFAFVNYGSGLSRSSAETYCNENFNQGTLAAITSSTQATAIQTLYDAVN